jgi:RNA polymerase sigma-70 factor (ECF subfamily)
VIVGLSETDLVQHLLKERARLLAYIWSIVRDGHLAEDVFQEVSVLAVRKRGEIEHSAAFPTWLRKAARLHSMAALRRANRAGGLFSNEVLDCLDRTWDKHQQDQLDSNSSVAAALQHCMELLTPRSKQIVALRYQDKLSGDQVADRLNTKVHSVYVALSRIHRSLRECMKHALAMERNSYE